MGLTSEINELRQRLRNFDAGTIDASELTAAVSVYTQIEKRMRLAVKTIALGMKLGLKDVDASILIYMLDHEELDKTKELPSRTKDRGK